MALLSSSSRVARASQARAFSSGPSLVPRPVRGSVLVHAKKPTKAAPPPPVADEEDVGTAGLAAIALGLLANPIVFWSEYTLFTTGSGLPEGPGGALGAAEGVSYLVIVAIVAWSIYTKVSTGSGLPPGPSGLLGAVEGITYLSLLAGIVVFALKSLA